MNWIETLPAEELKPGDKKTVQVGDQTVLLINHCNTIYATSNNCPHWGLPLETGRLTDDCGLTCPWHRSGFDLATGDIKAWAPWPPGLGRVIGATSRKKVLPTYATRVEDGKIFVSFDEEAKKATPTEMPQPTEPVEAKAVEAKPSNGDPVDRPVTIVPEEANPGGENAKDKPEGKSAVT